MFKRFAAILMGVAVFFGQGAGEAAVSAPRPMAAPSLRVVWVSGPVTVSHNAVAGAVTLGASVVVGDRIRTGANGFVTLQLADGTRISLPSQTAARVTALDHRPLGDVNNTALMIERGRGEFQVAPLRAPHDRFEVMTPVSVSAVRGTQFRVGYDEAAARATLEVLRGRVAETAPHDGVVEVPAGRAAVRLAGARRLTVLPPPPRLVSARHPNRGDDITLALAAARPDLRFRVQLAADADFAQLFAETLTVGGVAHFIGVPDRPLYLRVTQIDALGVEGQPAAYAVRHPTDASRGILPGAVAPVAQASPAAFVAAGDATGPAPRRSCDARWHEMSAADQGRWASYGRYLDHCLSRCPALGAQDAQDYFEGRVRRSCDAHWQRLIALDDAGKQSYDTFIRRCARSCAPPEMDAHGGGPVPELTRMAGDIANSVGAGPGGAGSAAGGASGGGGTLNAGASGSGAAGVTGSGVSGATAIATVAGVAGASALAASRLSRGAASSVIKPDPPASP